MIKKLFKYSCPACGSHKLKAPAGFLGLPTACSDRCKTIIKVTAEKQFSIWQFSTSDLNKVYWRACRTLKLLDQDIAVLTYTDFIVWLFLKHGSSKIELARVYTGLMEESNGRLER